MGMKEEPKNQLPKIISRQEDGSYTVHDQIIHFVDGHKRYVAGVKWIWENEMLHLLTTNGTEFIVNKDKVLFVQRRLEFKNDSL